SKSGSIRTRRSSARGAGRERSGGSGVGALAHPGLTCACPYTFTNTGASVGSEERGMTEAGTGAGQTTDRSAASPGDRIEEVERPLPGERFVYLDNLKALLIAGIIAAHALIGYADLGSWSYQDIREVTLSPVVETVFEVAFLSLGGLFLIALFFFFSGLLPEACLARHGASRFVHDRLLRLGLPFAVYTLLLWPLFEFALLEPYLHRGSYWDYLGDTDPVLDNGPMWFVGVLLIYSLGYVVWRTRVPRPVISSGSLGGRHLLILAAAVAASTFLVRLVFPIDSGQPLNLHLWQWPACVVMFGLGVVAARQGGLRPVPGGAGAPWRERAPDRAPRDAHRGAARRAARHRRGGVRGRVASAGPHHGD